MTQTFKTVGELKEFLEHLPMIWLSFTTRTTWKNLVGLKE